jgi:hypothetical protein
MVMYLVVALLQNDVAPPIRSSRAKLPYKPKFPALKGALPSTNIHPPIRKYNTFEIISVDKSPDPLAT